MKIFLIAMIGFAAMTGCVPTPEAAPEMVGLANPASVNCVNLGGTLKTQKTAAGEVGMCHLPDGRIIEEWALFRTDPKNVTPTTDMRYRLD